MSSGSDVTDGSGAVDRGGRVYRLLIHSARQVVRVTGNGETALRGQHQLNALAILEQTEHGDGISIVANSDGRIEAIGFDSDIKKTYDGATFETTIDASNKSIVPGLVDGHTHAVWVGDRVHEFALKLAGATYLEIHSAGGGIHFTVDHVQRATDEELYTAFKQYARHMLEAGTTLVECKTGYGLKGDAELKMLRVLERARHDPDIPLDISVTYCAAHAVPKGSDAETATNDIINVQLPDIKTRIERGELHVDNIDVFCELGVFSVDQTRRILEAGKQTGLAINFHGEELHCLHSAEMGAALAARAISHLEEVSDEGITAMAASGTAAVLLPTTAYILRLTPPRARDMINAGVIVALGSDFNPNAHCLAMPVVMHLACVLLRLSMPEALAAATINSAASLSLSHSHGSLETGKVADLVIIDAPRWEHLIYQLGSHHNIISHVIKNGHVVHAAPAASSPH